MAIETHNPSAKKFQNTDGTTMFKRFQYSAAVKAGGFLYVAGQVGFDENGSIPEADKDQIEEAFRCLKQVIEGAGGSMSQIIELVSYHVGLENHLADFMETKSRYVPEPYPTWTILEVAGLARKEFVIEIKAVAYLGGCE